MFNCRRIRRSTNALLDVRTTNPVLNLKEGKRMARNPNDTAEEKEYVFEIHGEIVVTSYSEEQAEGRLRDDLADLVREGLANETIEIQ